MTRARTLPPRDQIGPNEPLQLAVAAALPLSAMRPVPRRGLSRVEAAMYIGISPSKFDEMVADRRMPTPRRIDGRKVWDVREVDLSFDELPKEDSPKLGTSWEDR